ncbi:STAS domain-containing protein [Actinomadura rupiterrae]|uniref:STAS domain-containing protein n=1 Tax=Actinomadura rupiterrae TaxID=559627 RepID=UPI0020A3014C|nr:STAS domain-containing protein [Actinomadura rupiterrae]MCP2342809.1 anti-anti-sigma factor [Actinomadura rupiterrae]
MEQLRLRVSPQTEGHLVTVAGELDLATAPALHHCLRQLLEEPGTQITVDLSEVEFIDGSGLAVLLHAERQARTRRRSLLLLTPAPRVQRLLQVTRTKRRFFIYPHL